MSADQEAPKSGGFASWAMKAAKGVAARAREELERQKQLDAEIRRERNRDTDARNAELARQAAKEAQAEAEAARAAAAEAERLENGKAVLARAAQRWPEHVFPRVPVEVLKIMQKECPGDNLANCREDMFDIWESMLNAYPTPPATDEARKVREAAFWREKADRFSDEGPDGRLYLKPKQHILDFFAVYEKWVFREYYAATGIVLKTYYGEEFIRHMLWQPARAEWVKFGSIPNKTGNPMLGILAGYREGYEKSWNETNRANVARDNERQRQEAEAYGRSADAHREKWGEWFFFNVEQTFHAIQQPASRTFSRPSDEL